MSKGVPAVNSAEVCVASGALGAGIGYVLAPRKYNLEQLLMQDTVEFEKTLPQKYISESSAEQINAYNLIKDARKNLTKAFNSNAGEAKLVEYTRAPKLIEAYKSIKKYIPKAHFQTALITGLLAGVSAVFVRVLSGKNN